MKTTRHSKVTPPPEARAWTSQLMSIFAERYIIACVSAGPLSVRKSPTMSFTCACGRNKARITHKPTAVVIAGGATRHPVDRQGEAAAQELQRRHAPFG